jgi:hypothetical protein
MSDPIAIVEATYSLGGDEHGWLTQLGATIRRNAEDDRWLWMHTFDATSQIVVRSQAFVGPDGWMASPVDEAVAWANCREVLAPLDDGDTTPRIFHLSFVCTLRQFPALLRRRSAFPEDRIAAFEAGIDPWLRKWDMADELIVNAQDPTRIGCVMAVPMRRAGPLHPREEHRWSCVAAHMASAFRIRRQIDGRPLDFGQAFTAEAVLDQDGRLEHAEPPAQGDLARAVLRHAVKALDRARGPLRRRDPEGALALWQGLVAGRWSLVDHFDSDGRRFVVAHRNDPSAPDARGLTLRERQVLAYAALGHANKVIAYELGLSVSTVSTHLTRARAKLRSPLGAVVALSPRGTVN